MMKKLLYTFVQSFIYPSVGHFVIFQKIIIILEVTNIMSRHLVHNFVCYVLQLYLESKQYLINFQNGDGLKFLILMISIK